MTTEAPFALVDGTRAAGADLRTGAQYRFMELDANGDVVLCNAVTDRPYGVLQNNPNTGEEAEVCIIGITKLETGAAIAIGVEIGTAADGQADAKVRGTDLDEFIVGSMIDATAAAAELGRALINCAAPCTAAAVA